MLNVLASVKTRLYALEDFVLSYLPNAPHFALSSPVKKDKNPENVKTSRKMSDILANLLMKNDNIGDNPIIDVACTHEFCGNYFTDVGRNWQLCVNKLLETTPR